MGITERRRTRSGQLGISVSKGGSYEV